jgi:VIT1/CCC1 family predicted Fe2+/Mn2+ transporter
MGLYVSWPLGDFALFAVVTFQGRLAGQSLRASGGKFFLIVVTAAGLGCVIGLGVQVFFPGITVPAG